MYHKKQWIRHLKRWIGPSNRREKEGEEENETRGERGKRGGSGFNFHFLFLGSPEKILSCLQEREDS
jgi:hypothetical protein